MAFSGLKRLLGIVEIEEEHNVIVISGVASTPVLKAILAYWNTSKIGEYMFNKVGNSYLTFYSFFAPDMIYVLRTLIEQRGRRYNSNIFSRVIDELTENTWLKNIDAHHPNILNFDRLNNITFKLLPHQMEFLQTYNEKVPKYGLTGYLLGAVPGSGKTISGLALSECLEADVVICVVPKNSLDAVWRATIETKIKTNNKLWVSNEGKPIEASYKFYVAHYETLQTLIDFFKTKKYHKPVIIIDESHNFNEVTSLRTLLLVELCKITKCQHVLWSSGTLIKAIGNEAIPALRTIDPLFTPNVEERFRKIYGKSASRAVDILRNRLGLLVFKVDKIAVVDNKRITTEKKIMIPNGSDYTLTHIKTLMTEFILKQLKYYESNMPMFIKRYDLCINIHKLSLNSSVKKVEFDKYQTYIEMIRKFYDPETMKQEVMYCNAYELKMIVPTLPADLREEFKSIRSIIKYYKLKVQGEALGRILGKQRAQCHIDMVPYSSIEDDINNSIKKTVLFTSFVGVVDAAYEYLVKKGFKPLKIYGDTNKDLSIIVKQFYDDADANPLIATFQSLSTAVPLTVANTAILMNSPFRSHEYEQSTARVDRIGQDTPVEVINLLLDTHGDDNISTRSADIKNWSQEQVAAILGTKPNDLDGISLEWLVDLADNEPLPRPNFINW